MKINQWTDLIEKQSFLLSGRYLTEAFSHSLKINFKLLSGDEETKKLFRPLVFFLTLRHCVRFCSFDSKISIFVICNAEFAANDVFFFFTYGKS